MMCMQVQDDFISNVENIETSGITGPLNYKYVLYIFPKLSETFFWSISENYFQKWLH